MSGVGFVGRVRSVGIVVVGDGGVALGQSLFPFLSLGLTTLLLSQPLVTRSRGGRLGGRGRVDRV